MKINIIPLLFIILLLPACDSIDPKDNTKAREALVGTWKGNGDYDVENSGTEDYWKATRYADGQYDLEILTLDPNKKTYEYYKEKGQWQVNDGYYTEVSTDNDETKYIILDLSSKRFDYNDASETDHSYYIQENRVKSSYSLRKPPSGYTEK
ncbi:hypothetical protein H0A36_08620 [Endozoicomonas sp. SM1973]|uniref:Lipocalin-like domain-containing protein n=1 Tax=Spartinivicinus marinus TaxID=2994442 RepID=A0A853I9Z0_9GAMM|nr:hypothetical protein [Spartinivicinus marinus]MCX4027204.1 hypothetical protein [Spartinivicinus marinus]NYZ66075.1 hypothetical protein [Spartinivicinus marinus]